MSASIIEGESPGTLRAFIIEDESTWSSDKTWWENPKITGGLERHLEGRRQAISIPPRQATVTNFPKKFLSRLERKIFGEDVKLKLFEEYPNYFLEATFEDESYHSQIFQDTNLVDLYNELKEYHFNE